MWMRYEVVSEDNDALRYYNRGEVSSILDIRQTFTLSESFQPKTNFTMMLIQPWAKEQTLWQLQTVVHQLTQ